jgi:signal transduction histidine kinase
MHKLPPDNLLLVDDNLENIRLLNEVLSPKGYQISFADSGEQALAMVAEDDFDLILLDVMMPGLNGFETCRKLKELERFVEIPVIFITARTDKESLNEAFSSGGSDYISKPIKAEEVLLRVDNQLRIRHLMRTQREENQAKDRFLSIISHDLRGPMGTLMHLSSSSENDAEESADALRKRLDTLNGTARRTYQLLERLLQWSRAQSGTLNFTPVTIPAATLVEVVISELTGQAESKRVALEYEMEEGLYAKGDENMLSTSLRNLVGNALKFSPSDSKITIRAWEEKERLWFEIRDQGIGIPKDKIPTLFQMEEKFVREGTKGEPGSGLGLLLVHEFVAYHDGELKVESEEGEGTSFRFHVPLGEYKPLDMTAFM